MKKLLYFSMLVAVTSANEATAQTTRMMTTTEFPWHNLDGKMVTISPRYYGISFFAPYKPGLSTTASTNAPTVQYYTPAPTPAGISVCLRYVIDYRDQFYNFLTLNPSSSNSLRLRIDGRDRYGLIFPGYEYNPTYLTTDIVLWSMVDQSLWTSICLTVDSRKNVVQMFSGRKMSIRKILPRLFVPQGKPGIKFSGFNGQVTDVQMWDYPLSYKEVFAYMNFPKFRLTGSVLKWSHISYSVSGDVLVEDTYENQAKQPFRGELGKKKKEKKMFSSMEQAKTTSNQ